MPTSSAEFNLQDSLTLQTKVGPVVLQRAQFRVSEVLPDHSPSDYSPSESNDQEWYLQLTRRPDQPVSCRVDMASWASSPKEATPGPLLAFDSQAALYPGIYPRGEGTEMRPDLMALYFSTGERKFIFVDPVGMMADVTDVVVTSSPLPLAF